MTGPDAGQSCQAQHQTRGQGHVWLHAQRWPLTSLDHCPLRACHQHPRSHLELFFCLLFVKKLSDLPGGQINDPLLGKDNFFPFLPAPPLSLSWTLEGLFELTRCPSIQGPSHRRVPCIRNYRKNKDNAGKIDGAFVMFESEIVFVVPKIMMPRPPLAPSGPFLLVAILQKVTYSIRFYGHHAI